MGTRPASVLIGDFDLRIQGHQGNRAIRGRQRMGHITAQRPNIADLRAADQAARFDQSLGMPAPQVLNQ